MVVDHATTVRRSESLSLPSTRFCHLFRLFLITLHVQGTLSQFYFIAFLPPELPVYLFLPHLLSQNVPARLPSTLALFTIQYYHCLQELPLHSPVELPCHTIKPGPAPKRSKPKSICTSFSYTDTPPRRQDAQQQHVSQAQGRRSRRE